MNIPQPSLTPSATPLLAFTDTGVASGIAWLSESSTRPVTRSMRQKRQILASALMLSAQNGHFLSSSTACRPSVGALSSEDR